jgi:hypothetical protein
MSTINYPTMYSFDTTALYKASQAQLYHMAQVSLPLLSQLSQPTPATFPVYPVQDYLTLQYNPQWHPSFVNSYPPSIPQPKETYIPTLATPQVPPIPSFQASVANASPCVSPRQPSASPCVSPRQSSSPNTPRTSPRKTDHTNDFGRKFQALIHNNQKANSQWRKFRNENKGQCTIKRCIRLRLAFCEKYGHEFSSLVTSKCFRGLGTRSNCRCALSSQSPSDQSPPSPMSMSPPSPSGRDSIGSPMMACSSPPTTTVSFQSSWNPSSTLPDHQAKVVSFLEQLSKSPYGRSSIGLIQSDPKFCTDFANS